MGHELTTVLLADENDSERRRLRDYLADNGYLVRDVADGRDLLLRLQREIPHLILLDLQLPYARGMGICRHIKQRGNVPIIVLTSLTDERTKVRALSYYVDDYLVKPVSNAELLARVRCVLRRAWLSWPERTPCVRVGENLDLDFLCREVRRPEGVSRLTPMECRLLQILVQNAGRVVPTELLLDRLWGDSSGSHNSLWEHIRRLRQ
nr:response regulator transcription factor [Dehalococcoidales bacterium]